MRSGKHWKAVHQAIIASYSGPGLQKLYSIMQPGVYHLIERVAKLAGPTPMDIDDLLMVRTAQHSQSNVMHK